MIFEENTSSLTSVRGMTFPSTGLVKVKSFIKTGLAVTSVFSNLGMSSSGWGVVVFSFQKNNVDKNARQNETSAPMIAYIKLVGLSGDAKIEILARLGATIA